MKFLVALLVLGLAIQAMANGTITVEFDSEDPVGFDADAVIIRGESLEATITIDPAPQFPVRLDITSTLPNIIFPSHDRLSFNTGQTTGTITLESPSNGDIGYATIIVEPEVLGRYSPLTFEVLVQGTLEVEQLSDCVGAGVPADFGVTLTPPAPQTVQMQVTAHHGHITRPTIVNGQNYGTFTFSGTQIEEADVIVVFHELYFPNNVVFDALGTIVSTHDQIVAGIPFPLTVSVIPTTPVVPVTISILPDNGEVDPDTVTLSSSSPSAVVTYQAEFTGPSKISFSGDQYCPLVDQFTVIAGPDCLLGFNTNILGTLCAICPGNFNTGCLVDLANTCNFNGDCDYSHCNDQVARCVCDSGFEGSSCQFDGSVAFEKNALDSSSFTITYSGLQFASRDVVLTAPGNLIAAASQVGNAFSALYDASNPFPGAVDPTANPPANTFYTGFSFLFETVCFDNAPIEETFANDNAVQVFMPINLDFLDEDALPRLFLYYWDANVCAWVDALTLCSNATQIQDTDFHDDTVTTVFCRPGQYALFEVGVVTPAPNTGHSNNHNPDQDLLSADAYATTGQTGFAVVPPTPQPYFPPTDEGKPSPPKPNVHLTSSSDASATSVSLLLVAIAAVFVF